jgi:molecular chaperone GrpE
MKSDSKGPVTTLKEEFEQLERDCNRLKDDHLRALADFDNFRRRIERDIELSRRAALEGLVVDLLPVLDNFERAAVAPAAGSTVDGIRKGMELIHRQLCDALSRHGLEQYTCLGSEFDPRRAEAIGFLPAGEDAANIVVHEACKGYACGGRVLRPARVVVTKKPDETPEPAAGADGEPTGSLAEEEQHG